MPSLEDNRLSNGCALNAPLPLGDLIPGSLTPLEPWLKQLLPRGYVRVIRCRQVV